MNYADSGFIVSLYRPSEKLSRVAWQTIKETPGAVILSPLSLLEIRNALNLAIRRGEMGVRERDAVLADIQNRIETGFFQMAEVGQSRIYARAAKLSDRYTPEFSTRSLDLMHVATALLCKAERFLSTDSRQREAAKAEGFDVHPIDL